MAQWFTPSDSFRTVQVFAPNVVSDVMVVGVVTQPSGIYFRVPILYEQWLDDDYDPIIDPIAQGIESASEHPNIIGLVYEQDVNASGLLIDNMVVTVQVTNPRPGVIGVFTGDIRARTYWFQGQAYASSVAPMIAAEIQRLTRLANA